MIVFAVENSTEGVYSALYQSFVLKIKPHKLVDKDKFQPAFDEVVYNVSATDTQRNRVKTALQKYAGEQFFKDMRDCFLSNCYDLLSVAFRYGYQTLKERKSVIRYLVNDNVYPFVSAIRAVKSETEKQFNGLQFFRNRKGVNTATFTPLYDITELIAPLLFEKYKDKPFIVKDLKHEKIAMSDGHKIFIGKKEKGKIGYLCYSQLEFLSAYEKLQ